MHCTPFAPRTPAVRAGRLDRALRLEATSLGGVKARIDRTIHRDDAGPDRYRIMAAAEDRLAVAR
jgi:hypothetical protein